MNEYNILENLASASLLLPTSASDAMSSHSGSAVNISNYIGKVSIVVGLTATKDDHWVSASLAKSSNGSTWTNVATFGHTTASVSNSGSIFKKAEYDVAGLSTWLRGSARASGSTAVGSIYLLGVSKYPKG